MSVCIKNNEFLIVNIRTFTMCIYFKVYNIFRAFFKEVKKIEEKRKIWRCANKLDFHQTK